MRNIFGKILKDKGISLAAAWSFNQLAYAIVYPFIPIYLCNERGFDYSTVSIIFPLLGLAAIIAPLPCGYMTDRFGYSVMMLSGQAVRGLIFFVLAAAVYFNASFWVFAVLLMFNTAVGSAFQVGSDSYLFHISDSDERPVYYSKIRIGFNIGWAIGPMVGAFFAKTPFWLFFIFTGILCIIGTVYTKFACCRNGISSKIPASENDIASKRSIYADIFGNVRFLMLISGTLFLMLLVSQLYSTLSVYSTKTVGISSKELGMIYSLNGFMVLALQFPLVALLSKIKRSIVFQLILGVLLYAVGYFQLGFVFNAYLIALAVAIITVGEIIIQPSLYTAVSVQTRKENAGRMFSVYSLMRGIGYAVGPWIGGQLFGRCNPIVLWSILSSFALIAAVFFISGEIYAKKVEKY